MPVILRNFIQEYYKFVHFSLTLNVGSHRQCHIIAQALYILVTKIFLEWGHPNRGETCKWVRLKFATFDKYSL